MLPRLPVLAVLIVVLALPAGGTPAPDGRQTRRTVVVADVHGSLDGVTGILRAAGLIDTAGRWAGGEAHLVQTGDLLDRGDDVRQVLDLLMRLESEARRAGGQVDVLFGNHEGMNIIRDLRDVSPGAYAAFVDRRSEDRRRRAFDAHAALVKRAGGEPDREAWMAAHPPGFVEYIDAFGPRGRYGRWLRARKVVLQAGDTLFMHAGLPPDTTATLEEVNRGVEQEIRSWDAIVATLERRRMITSASRIEEILNAAQVEIGRIVEAQKTGEHPGDHVTSAFIAALQHLATVHTWALVSPDGPLWYRGLATLPPSEAPAVEALLGRYAARRIVLGHTPQLPGRVTSRFDGRVILADTGMLSSRYQGGQPSAVELQGDRISAIYLEGPAAVHVNDEEAGAGATPRPVK